jgi:predicted outer membrane repeat protein
MPSTSTVKPVCPTPNAAMRHLCCLSAWARCFLLSIAGLTLAAAPVSGQTIPNPSFEANAAFETGQGHIADNASIVGWTGTPANLVGLNPAGGFNLMAGNGAVPNGTRVAFLQSNGDVTSTLSTTITGLVAGRHYRVQFRVNSREASIAPRPSYRLNGGTAVPIRTLGPVHGTNPYETVTGIFTATGTAAELEISNATTSDSVLLVDNFTISSPTVITVTNTNTDGAGSLRAAMAAAAATAAFNRIVFAPALNGATIFFTQEDFYADASGVIIDASALPDGIDLRGSLTNPVFNLVNAGTTCLMIGLKLSDGRRDVGAALLNEATLTMRRCRFFANEASVAGGAIYNHNGGFLELMECTFDDNSSEMHGGAIYNQYSSRVFVNRCTFVNNHCMENGGAIFADAAGTMDVRHSTFVGNTVADKGGAIYGGASITHCTIWQNNAGGGGRGIFVDGQITCENSIVAGNGSNDITNDGIFTRVGANIIQNFTQLPGSDQDGPPAINLDPQLSALADNGGPTGTAAIAAESPARNAAVDSTATTDQRGKPIVETADIGAYEMQAGTFVLGGPATQKTSEGQSFSITIHRSGGTTGRVAARLLTIPGTATAADYAERPNTSVSDVIFEDGDPSEIVLIPITSDRLIEGNHTFTVALSLPTATPGADLGAQSSFVVTIADPVIVTHLNATGAGSLAQALVTAKAAPGPDSIIFAPGLSGGSITLSSQLVADDAGGVLIDGFGLPAGITLDGGPGTNRVMYVPFGGMVTLRRLTVTGGNGTGSVDVLLGSGSGTSGGGGLYNSGLLTLERCTVSGNTSPNVGGGIANFGILRMDRCTISGNTAAERGGGIFTNIPCFATHCTITENTATAQTGGGIHNTGPVTLEWSIVAGNSAGGTGDDVQNNGGLWRIGTNFVPELEGAAIVSGPGTVLDVAPQLLALASNGGPTQTHAFEVSSPVRNAAITSTITSDQRGQPVLDAPDVGAFEMQAGRFVLSAATYKTLEGSPAEVTIDRGPEVSGTVMVRLVTKNGTAIAPVDYEARENEASLDIEFIEGELSKVIEIPTVGDFLVEGNQTFTVALGIPTPTAGATLGTPISSTVTIVDPIQVTRFNDDGAGSLRQAFAAAKAKPGPDSIHLSPMFDGKRIILGEQIAVDDADGVTLDASNLPGGFTLDGGPGKNRVFAVGLNGPSRLTLRSLAITGGNADGPPPVRGGAIISNGAVTLERCTLYNNSSPGEGGAIASAGDLTLTQCTLAGNAASLQGGAVFMSGGNLTVTHCTIADNHAGAAMTGGGIYHGGVSPTATVTVERSIVTGNAGASPGADIHKAGPAAFVLIGASYVNSFLIGGPPAGSGNMIDDDPLLGPLAANGGSTLTRALMPGSPARDAGAASLILSDQRGFPMAGDAPDVGAFEVQAGGTFVLGQPIFTTPEGAPVSITVRREGGFAGPASVRVFTKSGTAVSPGDFEARANDATSVIDFVDGDVEEDIGINTVADPDAVEPSEKFTVQLGTPTGGATVGAASSAQVVIFDFSSSAGQDSAAPGTPVISTPAAGAEVGADVGGSITVTGTVSDNKALGGVEVCDSNGVVLGSATLAKPGAMSSAWSASIVPGTGNFTIKARSSDVAGTLSAGFSAARTFKVLRPLLVTVAGNGAATAGFVQKSFREVGKPYAITAMPAEGSIFAFWEIVSNHTSAQVGLSAAALEKRTITFIHREGLALRAKFVANPYVASVIGTYNGSVKASEAMPDILPAGTSPGDGTPPALDTEGYISVLVQGSGAFSGSLKIDGMTLPVAGTFDHEGTARFGPSRARSVDLPRAGKSSLVVSLLLDHAPPNAGEIRGAVWQVEGGQMLTQSDILAGRVVFNSANPVPTDPFLGEGGANGRYTVVFRSPGGDPEEVSQGHGHGMVTLTRTGNISFAAALSDGVAFTTSTTLSQTGKWRLFAQLYGKQGAVAGDVVFNFADPDHDFSADETLWVRPVQDVQHYPAGWRQLLVATHGAKYTVSPHTFVVGDIAPPDADGDLDLRFANGLLPSVLTKKVGISGLDIATNMGGDTSFSLVIHRDTGVFSGTFTHSDTTKPRYRGVIFQKRANFSDPRGYGFFLTTRPKVKDYTGQSGSVLLVPQP